MTVTLAVGTNDCATARSKEEVVKAYDNLLNTAATKVPAPDSITVSSILPRNDKAANNVKLLNKELENLSKKHKTKFANNDASFLLGDGSLNDGYFSRVTKDGKSTIGHNPSFHGTQRLAKNLELKVLPKFVENVCRSKKQSKRPKPTMKKLALGETIIAPAVKKQNRQDSRKPRHRKDHTEGSCCWYCGENNHSHHACRHGRPIKCSACNLEGHKAKHCSA